MATSGVSISKAGLVAIMCMVVVSALPYAAQGEISCQTVAASMYPCVGYVMGGGQVTASCCNGINSLYRAAATTPDRQATCRCLEQLASGMSGINPDYATSLPAKCGVNIPYKISPTTDCSKVK